MKLCKSTHFTERKKGNGFVYDSTYGGSVIGGSDSKEGSGLVVGEKGGMKKLVLRVHIAQKMLE